MEGATFIGSNVVLLPVFLVGFTSLLIVRRGWEAAFLAVAFGGSLLLNGVLKPFFQRPRPQLPWAQVLPDYSFPSVAGFAARLAWLAVAAGAIGAGERARGRWKRSRGHVGASG